MSILRFGYETRFREMRGQRGKRKPSFLRPVSPVARLHFLVTLRQLKHLIPPREQGRILEAGCKQGHTSFWLSRFYPYHVAALDLDAALVVENQRLAEKLQLKNLSFLQRDLTRPLALSAPIDLVLCSHVLEHIEADVVALRNLFDATATNGYLVILVPGGADTVPYFTQEELEELGHVRAGYTLSDLERKISEAGFKVLSGGPAVGLWGAWANRIDFKLCQKSKSILLNGIGWALASVLAFFEYWFPIRPKWELLMVAQKITG